MFGIETSGVVAGTLWVLVGSSIITWAVILTRVWLQWRQSRGNAAFCDVFWNAADMEQAGRLAGDQDVPLARVCKAGVAVLRDAGCGRAPTLGQRGNAQDILERRLRQQVRMEQRRSETGLTVLASIGSTAPFVGLFGTVWGIMHALREISQTGSAALDVVAGPIGEALVATALGIATAVPAVLAYNYGVRRVRLQVAELEDFAAGFLHAAFKAGFRLDGESRHGI